MTTQVENNGVEGMINRKLSRRLYWSQLRYCQLQGQSPYSQRPVSAPSRIALNTYAGAEPVQFYQEVRRRARNFMSKEELEYIRKARSTFRNRRELEVKTYKRPLEALSFLENKGTSGTSIKQLIEKIARRRARSQIAFEIEKKKLEFLDPKEILSIINKEYRNELASNLVRGYTQGYSYEEHMGETSVETPSMAWSESTPAPRRKKLEIKESERQESSTNSKKKQERPVVSPSRRCLWLDGIRGRDVVSARRGLMEGQYWDDSSENVQPLDIQSKYLRICSDLGTRPLSMVLPQLKGDSIEIRYASLSEREAKALAMLFKFHQKFKSLVLSKSRVKTESMATLIQSLKSSSLDQIELSGNKLNHRLCQSFERFSKFVTNLSHLDLSNNNLQDRGVSLLVKNFKDHNSLKSLKLSNVQMTLPGAKQIGILLENSPQLAELDISLNSITEKGASFVAAGLGSSHSVTNVKLARTGISDKGVVAVTSACIDREEDLCIDLSGCNFQSIACLFLASLVSAMNGKTSKLKLILNSTIFSGVGGECLLRESALADNTVIVADKSRLLTLEKTSKITVDLSSKAGKFAAKVLLNHEKEGEELGLKTSTIQKIFSEKLADWNLQDKPEVPNKDILTKCMDSLSGDHRDVVKLEVGVIGKLENQIKASICATRPMSALS
ncbi:hypothetical protein HOP50_03g25290 [Chloropicon primus]|uniref:Leucine-rich repeat domain-containing protein n=1 Tax=Chloropicon primus TaxID=1764295 RepID=A0A5B8MI91_9CHLO|nr:hypothetical protein A3770_03p25290 [Chloropicon primus]UPQ99222.1 hypothetical protein HOP50_03g25290 [Chloropicon primus]|eukprot:QDZ20011.1 hypothetical protein A3770_03p25290 [Chloropicon primus]